MVAALNRSQPKRLKCADVYRCRTVRTICTRFRASQLVAHGPHLARRWARSGPPTRSIKIKPDFTFKNVWGDVVEDLYGRPTDHLIEAQWRWSFRFDPTPRRLLVLRGRVLTTLSYYPPNFSSASVSPTELQPSWCSLTPISRGSHIEIYRLQRSFGDYRFRRYFANRWTQKRHGSASWAFRRWAGQTGKIKL